jgi:hypothetical protein
LRDWRLCVRRLGAAATDSISLTFTSTAFHQRVDTLDTRDEFEAPADVERGAAADVTSMPSTYRVSPFGTPSVCAVSIGGDRRLVWINSAGRPGSIHFVPTIAAADKPESTPLRRDHNQAARAR